MLVERDGQPGEDVDEPSIGVETVGFGLGEQAHDGGGALASGFDLTLGVLRHLETERPVESDQSTSRKIDPAITRSLGASRLLHEMTVCPIYL